MYARYILMASCLCFNAYAAPLSIVPTTHLPTKILPGGTTYAFYTVTNNTCSVQSGIHVKEFPPHVSQVFDHPSVPNLCGASFTLQPCNTVGSSCILELKISDPVIAVCDDLAVCLSDNLSCSGTNFPLNVKSSTLNIPLVSVGGSFNTDPFGDQIDSLPLAYTSSDGGNNWSLSSAMTLVGTGKSQGTLLAVNCSASTCSAVGYAADNTFTDNIPLAYASLDGGVTWSAPASFTPILVPSQAEGSLNGVSCVGTDCATVGQSTNGSGNLTPLAYTSTDGGNTWILSASLPPPPFPGYGALNAVTCANSYCVAVGASGDIGSFFPYAYTSSDGGNNWTPATNAFVLPGAATQGALYGITCTGLNCSTVGYYLDPVTGYEDGLAYTSIDGGNTWTLSSAIVPPSPSQPQVFLSAVSCTGLVCTALGQSSNSSFTIFLSVAYTSIDGGNTWSLPSLPPPVQLSGGLSGITIANTSMGVGASFNGAGMNVLPLSYISVDAGLTWILSNASIVGFALPAGQSEGELSGVSKVE